MKKTLDANIILEGIINDLANRSQHQNEIGDSVLLTELADKIRQVKKQYLFETSNHEHMIAHSS